MFVNGNYTHPEIRILGGTHGNEPFGVQLHDLLEARPIERIRSRIAHPQAVSAQRRYLGEIGQLSDHYPGSMTGDPEDVAAYRNLEWLGAAVGSQSHLIYDVHCNFTPEFEFFEVGVRASAYTVAGAHRLGFTRCIVRDDSFYRAVPNAVLLEVAVISPAQSKQRVAGLRNGLRQLAQARLADLLEEFIVKTYVSLEYYRCHEIRTTSDDGRVSDEVLFLERIGGRPAFTLIDFPYEQRRALGLSPAGPLAFGCWGHDNMSPLAPHLGAAEDGTPRREWFGSLYERIGPPLINGARLMFPE